VETELQHHAMKYKPSEQKILFETLQREQTINEEQECMNKVQILFIIMQGIMIIKIFN